ncbi:hypothetical protein F4778DRAFT_97781 [Xylariomycetidae sp. FL2044]|nr:hypothetical protein F4778DRAFT_97781 [Xylariomycetidae sp. FL2044]
MDGRFGAIRLLIQTPKVTFPVCLVFFWMRIFRATALRLMDSYSHVELMKPKIFLHHRKRHYARHVVLCCRPLTSSHLAMIRVDLRLSARAPVDHHRCGTDPRFPHPRLFPPPLSPSQDRHSTSEKTNR